MNTKKDNYFLIQKRMLEITARQLYSHFLKLKQSKIEHRNG